MGERFAKTSKTSGWTNLSEKVAVSAGSLQKKILFGDPVDQNPIGFDMAVPRTGPFPGESVISLTLVEFYALCPLTDHPFQFFSFLDRTWEVEEGTSQCRLVTKEAAHHDIF